MSETMTPARQLALTMRLSPAMVRKYAQAYEEITGERIAIIGRDGRQFGDAQRDALILAKGFVDENPGMSVDVAMRAALGRAEIAARRPGGEPGIDELVEALGRVAAPLQAELQGIRELLAELPELRQEVVGLRQEVATLRALPADELDAAAQRYGRPQGLGGVTANAVPGDGERDRKDRDGFLVRAARRLERLLGGRRNGY